MSSPWASSTLRLLAIALLAGTAGPFRLAADPPDRTSASKQSLELRAEIERRAVGSKSTGGPFSDIPTDRLIEKLHIVQKSIYGEDGRQEIAQAPSGARTNARAVAAVIPAANLTRTEGGWQLASRTPTFGARQNLCGREHFREQPSAADCTAFLTRPDIVLTAGHCVTDDGLASSRFVFGFELGRLDRPFPLGNVYSGIRVLGRRLEGAGEDWAVVQLDRPVGELEPLGYDPGSDVAPSAEVYAIGCPSGLPLKYAGVAKVRDADPARPYFVADLDTFGGNSGSPVFSASANKVVGILVRGAGDFVKKESGCYESLLCSSSTCQGEQVMRLARIPADLWR